MGKPNVAIVTPGTFPIPSFRSSSVERVVTQVSGLLKHDINFSIFGKKTKGYTLSEKNDGITYYRPSYNSRLNYVAQVANRLKKCAVSVIQVENRPRFARYIKQRFRKKEVWLCLHSTTYMTKPHITVRELRECLSYVDKVIVNSRFLKERLLMLVPHIAHKIEINYLGVNPDQFVSKWSAAGKSLKQELTSLLGYENKRVILFVGRLIEIKGVHHLLKVLPQIIAHYPDIILVIVGSAYYGNHVITPYVSRLHQMGNTMPNHVRFIPFVSYQNIQKWFNFADVVAVPSFADEAFGLVNVEAMSCGVPVIATNSGGIREIVVHGETGYLINPNYVEKELVCSVLDLLANDEKCRLMGEASIKRIETHFTWQHTAQRFHSLYLDHS